MKALIIVVLSSIIFVGCGQMKTNNNSTGNVLSSLNSSGLVNDQDKEELEDIDPSLLEEDLTLTETDKKNSIVMKLGGAELLIDFLETIPNKPEQIAMIINGIEVTSQVAANPQSFQALIASLVNAQIKGKDIAGIPLKKLIKMGLKIIGCDLGSYDFSKLFGVLVKGAFKLFLKGIPYGSIFEAILDPVLDNALGNNNSNVNTPPKNVVGSIIDTVGGAIGGNDPKAGGLLNLITNLFK